MQCLIDANDFYEKPENENLLEILSPPSSRDGFRIDGITIGPAKIKKMLYSVDVGEGEIAIAVNTIEAMAGSLSTYICTREKGKLKIKRRLTHMMS